MCVRTLMLPVFARNGTPEMAQPEGGLEPAYATSTSRSGHEQRYTYGDSAAVTDPITQKVVQVRLIVDLLGCCIHIVFNTMKLQFIAIHRYV